MSGRVVKIEIEKLNLILVVWRGNATRVELTDTVPRLPAPLPPPPLQVTLLPSIIQGALPPSINSPTRRGTSSDKECEGTPSDLEPV